MSGELSTKQCKKCKGIIPQKAVSCQLCGADQRNWFLKHKIVSILLILILIVFPISRRNYNANKPQGINSNEIKYTDPAIKISVKALIGKYNENTIAADELYKGKTLQVKGTIGDIGKDILNKPYITISQSDDVDNYIQCFIAETELQKATQLKKGQQITIEGKCSGKAVWHIIIDNSVFI
jgi:hypothetical protein